MPETGGHDEEFERVFASLARRYDFVGEVGVAIRTGIDDVLDGARTGRYDLLDERVSKTERAFVGTRIEILLKSSLGARDGAKLDMLIESIEVDIKTTIGKNWMIPTEAVEGLCLLIGSNDAAGEFRVGLLRSSLGNLTEGANKDSKRSVSAAGRAHIRWFGEREWHPLPPNFLLHLPSDLRDRIFALESGQQRVRETFRLCLDQPIPRPGLATIARQLDPMKRVRDARKVLQAEGIRVLSASYDADEIRLLGLPTVPGEFFVATRRELR